MMQKKQHAQTVAGALLAFTIPLILSGLLQQMFKLGRRLYRRQYRRRNCAGRNRRHDLAL